MLYGKSAYKSIPKDVINRLAKKAKEYGGNPLQMFNFLKSRRKYYTNMKRTVGKSGSGEYNSFLSCNYHDLTSMEINVKCCSIHSITMLNTIEH